MDKLTKIVTMWIDLIITIWVVSMIIITQNRIELLHDRLDFIENLIDTNKNEVVPDYQSLIQLHQ